MASKYLFTENIFVFPSTRRMNKQVSARLISEASLANIINKLIETDGFVITPEPESGDYADWGYIPEDTFEFNVHGYYFNVDSAIHITNLFPISSYSKIYANIYLDKNTDPNYIELKGQDDDNNFYKGVTFSSTDLTKAQSQPADYSLLLFSKESTTSGQHWVVPFESRLKFIYTFSLGVDGGEILDGDVSYD